jgi:2Fe-2S ferredoxin
MPKITFEPSGKTLEIDDTSTLREAAHVVGVNVHDRCGGLGSCCNCVVSVLSGMEHINAKTLVEDAVFALASNERLSCQCRITGDVVVRVD